MALFGLFGKKKSEEVSALEEHGLPTGESELGLPGLEERPMHEMPQQPPMEAPPTGTQAFRQQPMMQQQVKNYGENPGMNTRGGVHPTSTTIAMARLALQ